MAVEKLTHIPIHFCTGFGIQLIPREICIVAAINVITVQRPFHFVDFNGP